MTVDIAGLERRLIAALDNPDEHAKVRQDIRAAGLTGLADELDRIAEQWQADTASRGAR